MQSIRVFSIVSRCGNPYAPAADVDRLIIESCKVWLKAEGAPIPKDRPKTVRLSAFFDCAVSLCYAMDLLKATSTGYRFTASGITHENHVVFPYTWMCPLCVSTGKTRSECYLPEARIERIANRPARDFPEVERLAKPRARAIGDVGFKVLLAIVRAVAEDESGVRICVGGGRRGEFDMTFATTEALAFGEGKAKPLVSFPLVVNASSNAAAHVWVTPEPATCWLHVSATDFWVPLGLPHGKNWPLNLLPEIAAKPEYVRQIEGAWYQHLEAYRRWIAEPDRLRWLRFGCGNFHVPEDGVIVEKRVANTKELPGLDRTDDIKKGTTQLLMFSRWKFGCAQHALKAVLLGNTYSETHSADYLGPLSGLRLIDSNDERTEFIFDGIIGLTQNVINDRNLPRLLGGLAEPSLMPALESEAPEAIADSLLGSEDES
jgi:hypothetical protein